MSCVFAPDWREGLRCTGDHRDGLEQAQSAPRQRASVHREGQRPIQEVLQPDELGPELPLEQLLRVLALSHRESL